MKKFSILLAIIVLSGLYACNGKKTENCPPLNIQPQPAGTVSSDSAPGKTLPAVKQTTKKTETQEKKKPSVILITTSQACQCTLTRCGQAEKAVTDIIAPYSGKIKYDVIDYAKNAGRIAEISKICQLVVLPAVIILNDEGKLVKKYDGSIDPESFKRDLEMVTADGKSDK